MATFRFFTPPPAKGLVERVYAQIGAEFLSPAPVFLALSPVPDLLAATWSLVREALLAGCAPRAAKEVVAAVVSHTRHFGVDACDIGDRLLVELRDWAAAKRTMPLVPPVMGAEYLAVALAFQFLSRMESALLNPVSYACLGSAVCVPGASLPLIADTLAVQAPKWAGDSPFGISYAAMRAVAHEGGRMVLSGRSRQIVAEAGDLPMDDLPEAELAAIRLALLASLAPQEISAWDVLAFRAFYPSDADLVRVLAFGAITAVEHIESAILERESLCVSSTLV